MWPFSDFLVKKVQKIQIFGLQVSKIHILVVILLRIKLEKLLVLAYSWNSILMLFMHEKHLKKCHLLFLKPEKYVDVIENYYFY